MKKYLNTEMNVINDFFNKNPGAVLYLDKNARIIYANPATFKLFGNKDLVGNSWFLECPGMTEEKWKSLISNDKSFLIETEIAGACILFLYVSTDPSGDIFVTGTDITHQKINEKKLEEQKATISEMARFPDMNPGPVIRMDPGGGILLSNKTAAEVFGKDLLKKNWRELCPEITDETWNQILSSDEIIKVEINIGNKCYLFHHLIDQSKKLVFAFGSDITVNKLNEKKLEEQKEALAAMARFPDMNPGPVIRMDMQGLIILSNTASGKIFGKDITGQSWLQICPGLTKEKWDEMKQSEDIIPFETRVREKDFVFTHRHDFKSNLVFVYGADVTLQKLTEKKLRHAEKMASLGEMTAGVAHEIQNPLNFVNNFSELNKELLEEFINEKNKPSDERDEILIEELLQDIRQNLEKILHHGNRADAIVKNMLQHSRSSSGVKESTDINALTDEFLRLSYYGVRAKDKSFYATMKKDYDKNIGNIYIIPQDIGKVILNLINNAFYTVDEKKKSGIENYEPTVSVSTKKTNDNVFISVKDNGNGIPQNVLDKIFQPFFTTKPTGQGTGLGLSLSYDIVKAHGGELKVETKEGEGSEFVIQLPVK